MAAHSDQEILVTNELADSNDGPTANIANEPIKHNLVKSPLTNSNVTAIFVVTFDTRSGANLGI